MKLRLDVTLFLSWLLLFSTSTAIDGQSLLRKYLPEYEVTEVKYYSYSDNSSSSDSGDYANELNPISYDGWSLFQSWPSIYFIPSQVAVGATKITGVSFSNPNILRYEYDEIHGIKRLILHPISVGETHVTIFAEDDSGRFGRSSFPITVVPNVQPTPKDISEVVLNVGGSIDFHVKDLAIGDEEIPLLLESAEISDPSIASVYFYSRGLSIHGKSPGTTTIVARIYNATDLDRISVTIPVTVTGAVYGN